MTDKQPEALRLADTLEEPLHDFPEPTTLEAEAAAELRRQYAELESLRTGYAAARLEIESLKTAILAERASHGQAPASKIEGLTAVQEPLGAEFEKVLHDNLFDLYEESPHTASHEKAPAHAAPAAVAGPVAVLKFERGTPGRQNEMPRVVSCNWMPDGEYEVYLAAAPTTQPAPQQEVQANTKTHDLLGTMIGLFLGAKDKIGYKPGSVVDKVVAEAVEHLKDWPYPEPAPQQEAQEPVAVVVPCYTPLACRMALYSAKQDLPIGTQLYTSPQPTQAQAGAEPLTDGQKNAMWVAATIELPSPQNCYLRGMADAERAHGIGIKGGQHV